VYSKLILKLNWYGVEDNLLCWLISFISDRQQTVVINGCKSPMSYVTSGVPQGSVLGALLFLLFINDLPEYVSYNIPHAAEVKLFADDIKAYSQINSLSDALLFQVLVNVIAEWCQVWQLTINSSKSQVLHLGNSNYSPTPTKCL